jgi:hypothetical protein
MPSRAPSASSKTAVERSGRSSSASVSMSSWVCGGFRLRVQVSSSDRGVDRPQLVVNVTVDWHPLTFFPALNRGDIALEVAGDLFPRIQPVSGRGS